MGSGFHLSLRYYLSGLTSAGGSLGLGVQISDLDDLLDLVTEREHKFPGSYLRRAIGGFDTAIWDLRGKQSQKPVVELLGGTPGKLRAYASSMKQISRQKRRRNVL